VNWGWSIAQELQDLPADRLPSASNNGRCLCLVPHGVTVYYKEPSGLAPTTVLAVLCPELRAGQAALALSSRKRSTEASWWHLVSERPRVPGLSAP